MKTKVMFFRKGRRLRNNISFTYVGASIDIVSKFVYLGIVFTTGGSFSDAQSALAGQSFKVFFKLNKYMYRFTDITVKHKLDLFDKLVLPVLNYGSEVRGFNHGCAVGRVHLQYCKYLLGVKNDFVYGKIGRKPLQCQRLYNIVKFWIR